MKYFNYDIIVTIKCQFIFEQALSVSFHKYNAVC